jgi:hypothetical protein
MRSPPGEILVKHRFPDIAAGPLDERQQRVTSQVIAGPWAAHRPVPHPAARARRRGGT